MNKEKLTLQDVMKYPKARIYYEGNDFEIITIYIDEHSFNLEDIDGEINDILWGDCKLILRKIDSMTDEEKDEVEKITFSDKKIIELGTIVDYRNYSIGVMDYLRLRNIKIDDLPEGTWVWEDEL